MQHYLAILKIITIIEAAVQVIERAAAMRGGLTSSEKLTASLALIENIYNGIREHGSVKEIRDLDFALVAPIITRLVGALVTMYNTFGVFTKPKTLGTLTK